MYLVEYIMAVQGLVTKSYLLRFNETAENRESYTVLLIYAIKRGIWHFSKHFVDFYKVRAKSNVKR